MIGLFVFTGFVIVGLLGAIATAELRRVSNAFIALAMVGGIGLATVGAVGLYRSTATEQTAPSGDNPRVTYRTDAEREHDDKVAATQVSAAWLAVDIRTAIEKRGASQRDVMRAIRSGAIAPRPSEIVETRLMWVKPTPNGISLCVESDVTAAVALDSGNVFKYDSCNAGVPVTSGAS